MKNDKKIIFVVVEGISDKLCLQKALDSNYPNKKAFVAVMNGDLTSDENTTEDNIKERIFEEMYMALSPYCVDETDVAEIIHIVDTDGVYVNDDSIIENTSLQEVTYNPDKQLISAGNKFALKSRNHRKRCVLDELVDSGAIYGVPYRVFYMSCNLEHVLHDDPNISNNNKIRMAKAFAAKYDDHFEEFVDFITNSSFSETDGYKSSWDNMRYKNDGVNSIARLSNLGLVFKA